MIRPATSDKLLVGLVYAEADAHDAQRVKALIQAHGMRCCLLDAEVRPGGAGAKSLVPHIRRCVAIVVIVSVASDASHLVHAIVERSVAMHLEIMQLRIDDVSPGKSLAYLLASIKPYDAKPNRPAYWVDHLQSLMRELSARRRRRLLRLCSCGGCALVFVAVATSILWPHLEQRNARLVAVTNPHRDGMIIDLGYSLAILHEWQQAEGQQANLEDLRSFRFPAVALIRALGLEVPNAETEPDLFPWVATRLNQGDEPLCLEVGMDLANLQIASVAPRTIGGSRKLARNIGDDSTEEIESALRSMGLMPSKALPKGVVTALRRALEQGPGNGVEEVSRFKGLVVSAMDESVRAH